MSKTLLPFRYPGGKYYAIKFINPFLRAVDYDEYREPFFGGGAVFWRNEKVKYNWINDIYNELYITLKVMQDPEGRIKLSERFTEKEASKEKHEVMKNFKPKSEFEIAEKFYYLNRTSFSGKMTNPSWGYRPKRSLPPHRWRERIIPCGKKLEGVKITNLDFEDVITAEAKGKRVMMFVDPPYFEIKQNTHYVFDMSKEDHVRLCNLLKLTKHKFVLTYDDSEDIRKLYSWAHIYDLNFYYRINNSVDTSNKRKAGAELIITNFKIDNEEVQ